METKEIYAETVRHFLEPVLPLLDDPSVTEILINGHRTVYFDRDGRLIQSELAFASPSLLMAAARKLAKTSGRGVYDRKNTRQYSTHQITPYAVLCLNR